MKKQLVSFDTRNHKNWNDVVHEHMNRDDFRIINITTDDDPLSSRTHYRAWFEQTIMEAHDIPRIPHRHTLPDGVTG